jgi:predicted enzyme related to lactoylglutathione lyase
MEPPSPPCGSIQRNIFEIDLTFIAKSITLSATVFRAVACAQTIHEETMHTFAHIEIPTLNLDKAMSFYTGLFQWKYQPFFGDDYRLIVTDRGEMIGGLTRVDEIPFLEGFWNYIEVDNVDHALALAQTLGGRVIRPRSELPDNFGVYGVLQSPDGYNFGVWEKVRS